MRQIIPLSKVHLVIIPAIIHPTEPSTASPYAIIPGKDKGAIWEHDCAEFSSLLEALVTLTE